jgi:hypothetical protein
VKPQRTARQMPERSTWQFGGRTPERSPSEEQQAAFRTRQLFGYVRGHQFHRTFGGRAHGCGYIAELVALLVKSVNVVKQV